MLHCHLDRPSVWLGKESLGNVFTFKPCERGTTELQQAFRKTDLYFHQQLSTSECYPASSPLTWCLPCSFFAFCNFFSLLADSDVGLYATVHRPGRCFSPVCSS